MIGEIIKGLATTLKHLFQDPVTINYPEVKRPTRYRFKGRHELKRYDNGLERCIGCSLCAALVRPMPFLWKHRKIRMKNGTHLVNDMPALMKSTCCAAFFVATVRMLAPRRRLCWKTSMN